MDGFRLELIMSDVSKQFLSCHVAGFAHWDGIEVIDELKLGTALDMAIEEDNKYDPQAVALYYGKHKLGFIPADKNSALYQMLYFGYDIFDVFINRIDLEAHPERQLGITVRIRDARQHGA
jgi:hypothetical protein